MRYLATAACITLVMVLPASAQLDEKVADRFWESTKILEAIVSAPDGGIPQDLLRRSECVGVIPAVKRAAFGFGGRYGRGLVVCRTEGGYRAVGVPVDAVGERRQLRIPDRGPVDRRSDVVCDA